jgi:exonuclease SbcC
MQILRVELENIKSYERATVDFAPGVNAIMGHNGAGKSTILEAIGFALFDNLPYNSKDFLRQGARTGTVAVTFIGNLDERSYRVERRVGGSHLFVAYDVELQAKLCEGKVDVLAFVRKQTGADPGVNLDELFGNAIGVQQGTLAAAFLLTGSQRKPIFDALLQVDDYKIASDKLREPRNVLGERTQAVNQEVAILAARLERLPALAAAVQARAGELTAIEQSLTTLCARLAEIEARKAALDAVRAQIEQAELRRTRQVERCATLKAQQGEAQRQLAEAEQAAQVVAEHIGGHDQHVAAQAHKEQLDQQMQERHRRREEHAVIDKRLALAQSELVRLDERLAAITQAEATITRLAPAVRRQEELEGTLAELQGERGRLQEAVKSRMARQVELQQLSERERQLTAQLAQAEQVQQEAQQLEQSLAALREQITQCTGEQAALQTTAGELKRQNETLNAVQTALCPVCEQPLSEEHRSRMQARNNARLQELRDAYAASQKQMKGADAALQKATVEHKQRNDILRNLPRAEELEETRRRVQQATAAVADSTAAQSTLEEVEGRFQALTTELAALQNPRQQSAVAVQQAAERPQLLARQADIDAQRQTALDQLAALDAALTQFAALDAQLMAVTGTLRQTEAAYQAVLANRQLAAQSPQRIATLEAAGQALQAAQAALAEAEHGIESVRSQFDPVAYASISSEDQNLRREVGGQQARQTLLQQEQRKDEAELIILQEQQDMLAALRTQQTTLSRQSAVLDTVRNLLRQSGPYVTQALIRQISTGATQIFGELMQDFSRELQWQEDYGITLKVDGAERQFVQLSGGEQMSAALAVRLALVREISNLDIAFFDEPTANLDDVRREALAQQIMNVKGFRQLFVISHDDTFEQITQNLVRVKRHGSSSIVAPAES